MEMFRPLVKTHKCIYLKIEQKAEEEYEREIIKKISLYEWLKL